ncbi:leucine-rich PPR motif-containing protein, mitochondrial-like [Saccoglossus kowalevskii]|uniref:Leucine-rich PPR motif-containing protein, mitochondrial-like n=1 Tax=Saccoglossus kowalevskii TaxID=10224 RepID=A0ABM0MJB9_SACKO|nr:PREDICTED: leucine-rich PPR motif-containing protein, mitochondrial-like [Saccoglossus kowalevskii]
MDYIEDCYARFEMAPRFYDLLVKLIEAGNTEQLQTAMECGVQMLGNRNSLYTLIFAFLTTGKYNQAKSIIETSELVAVQARLQWYARLCIRMGLEEPLEKLIELSRNMLQCNRDQMYHHLLTLYAKTKDWQKCMKAWSSIQEEGFKPTPRTLRLLAHVLKTNGQPIPLEVSSILENDNAGER